MSLFILDDHDDLFAANKRWLKELGMIWLAVFTDVLQSVMSTMPRFTGIYMPRSVHVPLLGDKKC